MAKKLKEKFRNGDWVRPRDGTSWFKIDAVSNNHGGENYYAAYNPRWGRVNMYESTIVLMRPRPTPIRASRRRKP